MLAQRLPESFVPEAKRRASRLLYYSLKSESFAFKAKTFL